MVRHRAPRRGEGRDHTAPRRPHALGLDFASPNISPSHSLTQPLGWT